MKHHPFRISLTAAALVSLVGCTEPPPASPPEPVEITGAAAVAAARHDAADRFHVVDVSSVTVLRAGRYWVVDLRATNGVGLHYAVATDGSIRERRTVQ